MRLTEAFASEKFARFSKYVEDLENRPNFQKNYDEVSLNSARCRCSGIDVWLLRDTGRASRTLEERPYVPQAIVRACSRSSTTMYEHGIFLMMIIYL